MKFPGNQRLTYFLVGTGATMLLLQGIPDRGSSEVPSGASTNATLGSQLEAPGAARELDLDAQLRAQAERLPGLSWARDPFRPVRGLEGTSPVEEPTAVRRPEADLVRPAAPAPTFTGLCRVGGRPMAIVGDEIVAPGERLRTGHVLLTIEADRITVRRDGEQKSLSFGDSL